VKIKFEKLEMILILLCFIFAIIISLFHLSFAGFLGLSKERWNVVWAFSENGLGLVMSILLWFFSYGAIKKLFLYLFIPYFLVKLIYHFSCYANIYLWSKEKWDITWSFVCVICILFGLFYFIVAIKQKYNEQFKN